MSKAGMTLEDRAKRYVGRYYAVAGDLKLFVVDGVSANGRALRTWSEDGVRGSKDPDEMEGELLTGMVFPVPADMARSVLRCMHSESGVPVDDAIAWLEGTLEKSKDEALREKLRRWTTEAWRKVW